MKNINKPVMSIACLSLNSTVKFNATEELCRINFYLFENGGVLTSAGGSAWTMQASCASLPSPEWTQPLSTSISGASAQQNGLTSQELMWADVLWFSAWPVPSSGIRREALSDFSTD
jgi:hypothetical protein